jgi:hypothetical protein
MIDAFPIWVINFPIWAMVAIAIAILAVMMWFLHGRKK